MEKAFYMFLLLWCSFCFAPNSAIAQHQHTTSQTSGITVVSDTVDEDDCAADSGVSMSVDSSQVNIVQTPNIFSSILGNIPFLTNYIPQFVGWSGILISIVLVLLLILFLFAPIALIILIIYLLFRDKRPKQQTQPPYQGPVFHEQPAPNIMPTTQTKDAESVKDRAIEQICLGLGIFLLCLIISIRIGEGIGLLIVCYGIGKYLVAVRQKRREKNENQER